MSRTPITWRNVGQADFSDSNQLAIAGTNTALSGLNKLGSFADNLIATDKANNDKATQINTDNVIGQIRGATDLDALSALGNQINTETLRNQYGNNVDVAKVMSALAGRDNQIRKDKQDALGLDKTKLDIESAQLGLTNKQLDIAGKGLDIQNKVLNQEATTLQNAVNKMSHEKKVAENDAFILAQKELDAAYKSLDYGQDKTAFNNHITNLLHDEKFAALSPERKASLLQGANARYANSLNISEDNARTLAAMKTESDLRFSEEKAKMDNRLKHARNGMGIINKETSPEAYNDIFNTLVGNYSKEDGEENNARVANKLQVISNKLNIGGLPSKEVLIGILAHVGEKGTFDVGLLNESEIETAIAKYKEGNSVYAAKLTAFDEIRRGEEAKLNNFKAKDAAKILQYEKEARAAARKDNVSGNKGRTGVEKIKFAVKNLGGKGKTENNDPKSQAPIDGQVSLAEITKGLPNKPNIDVKSIFKGQALAKAGTTPKNKTEKDNLATYKKYVLATRPFEHSTPRTLQEKQALEAWELKWGHLL